jgi:hypothetical protein
VARRDVTAWPFVGRRRDCAFLRAELEAGRSIVLTGSYGIGRTCLVRHLAEEMREGWLFAFADLDGGPGAVWRSLFATLFPRARPRRGKQPSSVQWTRFRVLHRELQDRRRHVVVLDDVARLPAPRLDLMRRLRARFQIVGIAEDFLPAPAMSALCVALRTRRPYRLGRLGPKATATFFQEASRRHGFGWGAAEVRGLASAAKGFPLGMREMVEAELSRRAALGVGRRGCGLTPPRQPSVPGCRGA